MLSSSDGIIFYWRYLHSHRSETTRIKYCGGKGSKTGTKNVTRCSSWAYLDLSRKYSWWRMTSLSTSSTRIQKASDDA